MTESNHSDSGRLHRSAVLAAETLEAVDRDVLDAYDRACSAMRDYALELVKRGLGPQLVLGQMNGVAVAVFCEVLLPGIVRSADQ